VPEKFQRVRSSDGSVTAPEVIGRAVFVTAPTDSFGVFGMSTDVYHAKLVLGLVRFNSATGRHLGSNGLAVRSREDLGCQGEKFRVFDEDVTSIELRQFLQHG
jgi:hypothetical protein